MKLKIFLVDSLHIGVIPTANCGTQLASVTSLYIGVILFLLAQWNFTFSCFPVHRVYSEKETEDLIKREIEKGSANFDDAIQEVVKYVNDNGGWSNFIKTPIGQQFAASVKMKSKDITPRDFKKSHKKENIDNSRGQNNDKYFYYELYNCLFT